MAFIPGSNRPRPVNKGFRRVVEEPYRVNERITSPRVRVVGENIKVDVYPIHIAIKLAQDQGAFPGPKWPSRSLDELLEVTFRDANIDHDHHPGLLRLIGAKQDLT